MPNTRAFTNEATSTGSTEDLYESTSPDFSQKHIRPWRDTAYTDKSLYDQIHSVLLNPVGVYSYTRDMHAERASRTYKLADSVPPPPCQTTYATRQERAYTPDVSK